MNPTTTTTAMDETTAPKPTPAPVPGNEHEGAALVLGQASSMTSAGQAQQPTVDLASAPLDPSMGAAGLMTGMSIALNDLGHALINRLPEIYEVEVQGALEVYRLEDAQALPDVTGTGAVYRQVEPANSRAIRVFKDTDGTTMCVVHISTAILGKCAINPEGEPQ